MQIRIEDLFFLYEKDGEKVVALRGLFLTIESGECLVIKGPNGSGKSTLVQILSGFLQLSAGQVFFDNQSLTSIDPLELRRKYVATIDQKGNLLPDLTVLENLVLALSLGGMSRNESRQRAVELMSSHNLSHLSHLFPPGLSAGERQFCAVLAAVARNPRVLIADEPSGELDNDSAESIYKLLKSCAGSMTVILVTHDDRAESYADRIVRVRDGRISAQWLTARSEEPVIDPRGWMQVRQPEVIRPAISVVKHEGVDTHPLIKLENVDLSYGRRQLFSALSFEAHPGDFIAITGSSASGKTSLLKMIAGLQDPTIGKVFLCNQLWVELSRDARAELRRESLAFLAQGDNPIERLSIREYFESPPSEELNDFLTRNKRRLSKFSGGERARIEIHHILSLKRKILVLDEPTSQLDDKQSMRILELLVDHVNLGGVAVVSTRDHLMTSMATQVIDLK
jgi:ABC-type lipoprotein export system ATPase subunit